MFEYKHLISTAGLSTFNKCSQNVNFMPVNIYETTVTTVFGTLHVGINNAASGFYIYVFIF